MPIDPTTAPKPESDAPTQALGRIETMLMEIIAHVSAIEDEIFTSTRRQNRHRKRVEERLEKLWKENRPQIMAKVQHATETLAEAAHG